MRKDASPLDHVTVAAPCTASWDGMIGSERVRFCGQCELNVYNLSGMTKREAEKLISQREKRLCVRFYRRADGTILTKNCPVGLRALKRRVSRIATAAASAVVSFFAGIFSVAGWPQTPMIPAATHDTVIKVKEIPARHVMGTTAYMGDMIEEPVAGQLTISDGSQVN